MTNVKALNFLFMAVITTAFAQTNLSGNIGGMTLEKSGNPFIVGENITIPAGKKVTILQGCVFLFKPFTGIVVDGSLSVQGTAEFPVIFSSFNDSVYNTASTQPPDPFDWNGITISPRARKVDFAHFALQYSVYGIKSQTYDLQITQGSFTSNGQFNFTMNGEIQPVTETIPFNFNRENDTLQTAAEKKKPFRWKVPLGVGLDIAGAAGLGAAGYFLYQLNGLEKLYHSSTVSKDADTYADRYETVQKYAIISGSAGGVLLISGTTLLLTERFKRKEATAVIYPFFGGATGIVAVVDF